MKVGILSFEDSLTSKNLRGISTTTRYLQQNLKNVGVNTDLLVYGKGKLNYPKEFNIVRQCKDLSDLAYLKSYYDFIIYYTPGRSWEKYDESDRSKYVDMLNAVSIPFTFIYHSEDYEAHHPYKINFLSHPDCKFLTFIADGLSEIYKKDLESVKRYVSVCMSPPLNPLEYIKDRAESKSNSIIMTNAWVNFKRNFEYFEIVDEFIRHGITPYSAGSPSSNFYMNDILDDLVDHIDLIYEEGSKSDDRSLARYKDYSVMMSHIHQEVPWSIKGEVPMVKGANIYKKSGVSWQDYGSYYPEELEGLLCDKKFHWDVSYYKRNRSYVPRIEIVTLEAFNEGCLPIICKEATPSWLSEDSAILLSKYDYAEHLDKFIGMSDSERYDRLETLYKLIYTNLHKDVYHNLVDEISSCL